MRPPPFSPEINPKENCLDGIRDRILMNYAIDTVQAKLKQAIFPFERSPETIQPNTSYPIPQRHLEVKLV